MTEEISLRIKIVRKLVEHIGPYTGDMLTNYLCTPLSSEIKSSSELAEAKWFSLEEIQKLERIHFGFKQFLTDETKSHT